MSNKKNKDKVKAKGLFSATYYFSNKVRKNTEKAELRAAKKVAKKNDTKEAEHTDTHVHGPDCNHADHVVPVGPAMSSDLMTIVTG